jgi:hypothetical protein
LAVAAGALVAAGVLPDELHALSKYVALPASVSTPNRRRVIRILVHSLQPRPDPFSAAERGSTGATIAMSCSSAGLLVIP